jgi:hypothetical protein
MATVPAVPSVAVADLGVDSGDLSRPWRRRVRAGVYDPHLVCEDPRSDQRRVF